MFDIFIALVSFLQKSYYRLRYPFISIRGRIFLSRIRVCSHSSVVITGDLFRTDIFIIGNDSKIQIDGKMVNCQLTIDGSDSKICVGSQTTVSNYYFLIRSQGCSIDVGRSVKMLGGRIVCQGRGNYVKVGNGCLFSHEVELWNSDTHTIFDCDGAIVNRNAPIIIEDRVWCGKGVKVLKGVRIGADSVIGMSSVVSKSVPNGSIAAGVPARVVRSGVSWSSSLLLD